MNDTLGEILEELFRLRIVCSQLSEQVKWITQERDDLKRQMVERPT